MQVQFLRLRCPNLLLTIHGFFFPTVPAPSNWSKVFPLCGGKFQSPVNIITKKVKKKSYPDLKISFDNPCGRVTGELLNAGSSPVFNIDGSKGGAKLSGGPLDCDEYALQQFHFHFGCENGQGSEHLIDNQAFPAQVLITYYSYFMWNSKIIMGSNGIIVILYK